MNIKNKVSILLLGFYCTVTTQCNKDIEITPIENNTTFLPKLSQYNLFEGSMSALKPEKEVEIVELSTPLFTDYAEKQRLIKLPSGTKLIAKGAGLPDFPEGTILAKTFYYNNDNRDISKGRKIIETRLLIKFGNQWNVGVYEWNDTQTEALLLTAGKDIPISWKQSNGTSKSTRYHIPTLTECSGCHRVDNTLIPIGLTLKNMNKDIEHNGLKINQLKYFKSKNLLDTLTEQLAYLPKWDYPNFTLTERARAYLAVNCAHCHNPSGLAASRSVDFRYETPFKNTNISKKKWEILGRMEMQSDGKMPKLGTTLIHEEGVKLLKEYINSL